MILATALLLTSKNALVWFFLAGVILVISIIFRVVGSFGSSKQEVQKVDWSAMDDPKLISQRAYAEMDNNLQSGLDGFKRLQVVDPDNWEASAALGIAYFDKDNDASYQNLNRFYNQVKVAEADIFSPEFEDLALGMYMAGYHYHKRGNELEAAQLKSAAMKSSEFRRDFGSFRMKFAY